jgi:hypothetical protein
MRAPPAARKTAQPVTLATLEGGRPMTLAEAAATVDAHGSKVELRKDGELVVVLPPGVFRTGEGPWQAARILYTAHREVVACCGKNGRCPTAKSCRPGRSLNDRGGEGPGSTPAGRPARPNGAAPTWARDSAPHERATSSLANDDEAIELEVDERDEKSAPDRVDFNDGLAAALPVPVSVGCTRARAGTTVRELDGATSISQLVSLRGCYAESSMWR